MEVEQLKQFKFGVKWFSEQGVRQSNDDKLLITEVGSKQLFLLADGMGGYKDGALAASMAIEIISYEIRNNASLITDSLIIGLFKKAHEEINLHLNGAGTTIAGVLLDKSSAIIFWVGDARVYLKDHVSETITIDHSLIQLMQDSKLSVKVADIPKFKSTLTRGLGGSTNSFTPEIITKQIDEGTVGLICSDGVHHFFSDPEMFRILDKADKELALDEIKARCFALSKDNFSAILFYPMY